MNVEYGSGFYLITAICWRSLGYEGFGTCRGLF